MIERLGLREPTMRLALTLLEDRHGVNIVETGCARFADNWTGDGMSTLVFGEWATNHAGHLWTVDADAANLANCKILTEPWSDVITYTHDDSVNFLAQFRDPIDLLYLDSFDYPLLELVKLYGEDFEETVAILAKLGDDYIVEHHGEIIEDSQRHCEREIQAALPLLQSRTLVLIDDATLPGGGKARLARRVLAGAGWHEVRNGYQTLWSLA